MTDRILPKSAGERIPFAGHLRQVALVAYRALLPARLRRLIRRQRETVLPASLRFSNIAEWPPAAARGALARPSQTETGASTKGANLLGYISGEFGLGVSARAYASALLSVGYPIAIVDADIDIPHSRQDRSLEAYAGMTEPSFDTTVVFVNPDHFDAAMAAFRKLKPPSGRVIGCWFWELPRVPDAWMAAVQQVDEIVVATEFVAEAFRAVTDKPVTKIPFPLLPTPASALTRAHLGLPDDAFVFLCTFDCNSSLERKNPGGVIKAFREAFPAVQDDVRLLLKSSNGERSPAFLIQLAGLIGEDSRILLRDGVIDASHVAAMHELSDCYISLHRAEGLGLGMAESMRLGKPVIATGWSGNCDFMDESNSFLVDYRLVPVLEGQYPHGEGQSWAEPDTADAARQMRSVVRDRGRAANVAAAGRSTILREMSAHGSGQLFAAYLSQLPEFHQVDRSTAADNEAVSP
ncbi:glycosyltransferase family 4 protein [Xanthomonas indica]|uniref:Glycosyltransferase family 4 protein n=1 Tax=Xanthomonas indica TaxID=2912242 RepID=A0AAU8I8H5_9XANT|nr:glycosyltransferase family 4 protein [Xanthomonas indica]MCI2261668.1 glycosyltransferase family 4 protein [Xanthomonas indica]